MHKSVGIQLNPPLVSAGCQNIRQCCGYFNFTWTFLIFHILHEGCKNTRDAIQAKSTNGLAITNDS